MNISPFRDTITVARFSEEEMIKFQSFLSSSSGNCTFVTDDKTNILIDCGAPVRYIEKCLMRLGVTPDSLSGVFITHAHSDHISAAGTLSKKYNLPIFATQETFALSGKYLSTISRKSAKIISADDDIIIGDMIVHAFSIPHDISGAVSFTVCDAESKFGIATDSGHISDEIINNLKDCESVIVEANHDVDMLMSGPYPYPLKKRILSDKGHLSNILCGNLCVALAKSGTKSFWLGHLSEKNNIPEIAYKTVHSILTEKGYNVGVDVALNVIPKLWIEGKI